MANLGTSFAGDTSGQLPPLARFLDHTLLHPAASSADIDQLCREARLHGFHAVCVNGVHVARAAANLQGAESVVACTVGFPLGAMAPSVKALEARRALDEGARELDVVMQVGAFLAGEDQLVRDDLAGVVEEARAQAARVKVILETALLEPELIVRAAELVREVGADFVKTSTGYASGGATVEAVALLARTVGPDLGVKASGGIRSAADARRMIAAGATRIGSSACVAMLSEA